MRVVAIDVGGTHASCAIVDNRELIEVSDIQTDSRSRLADLLPYFSQNIARLSRRHMGELHGIGFGFCGLVDQASGRVLSTNHKYSDATELDLVGWARREFDLPLLLENDARLALLGECHSGAAQNSEDVVLMTLGTGIGTAALMEGKLLRGRHAQAGCLGGHLTIVPGGRYCTCGGRGCFEAEASTHALPGIIRDWLGFEASLLAREPKLDFVTLFRCAGQGDLVANEVRSRCIDIWGACAVSLIHAYDPELLILGGGVTKSSFPILEAIQRHVDSHAWTPWGKVQIRAAQLGSNAALLGAIPLFQERQ